MLRTGGLLYSSWEFVFPFRFSPYVWHGQVLMIRTTQKTERARLGGLEIAFFLRACQIRRMRCFLWPFFRFCQGCFCLFSDDSSSLFPQLYFLLPLFLFLSF
jgi:hypothetical protein